MNNTIAISNRKQLCKEKLYKSRGNILNDLRKSASLSLIAVMFMIGSVVALLSNIPVKSVMSNYSYDVLVILVAMELFTNLIAETGTALRLAKPEEMAYPLIFLNSDMASFITGLPLIVDSGTNAMVNLKLKKDRMNIPVGLKIFNLGFIQKQLAKQLEPLNNKENTNNTTEEEIL